MKEFSIFFDINLFSNPRNSFLALKEAIEFVAGDGPVNIVSNLTLDESNRLISQYALSNVVIHGTDFCNVSEDTRKKVYLSHKKLEPIPSTCIQFRFGEIRHMLMQVFLLNHTLESIGCFETLSNIFKLKPELLNDPQNTKFIFKFFNNKDLPRDYIIDVVSSNTVLLKAINKDPELAKSYNEIFKSSVTNPKVHNFVDRAISAL